MKSNSIKKDTLLYILCTASQLKLMVKWAENRLKFELDHCLFEQIISHMDSYNSKIEAILRETNETAKDKKSAAWTTSLCVVGNDMDKAVFIARSMLNDRPITTAISLETLANNLIQRAENYDGADPEGYIAGTLKWIAQRISKL